MNKELLKEILELMISVEEKVDGLAGGSHE